MNDDLLAEAARRRDEHLAQAKRLDDFIQTYRELQGDAPALPHGEMRHVVGIGPRFVTGLGRLSDTERVVVQIIREAGKPVPTQQLLKMLPDRGIVIGGKDPASTLAARLSRAPSLASERGVGWRLKDEPRQTNEAAGTDYSGAPAASAHHSGAPSETSTTSGAVEPVAGGGT